MTRPGFRFSTSFRVRYAEIDGQRIVFNSRYLEYADVAASEFWEWTGADAALGPVWTDAEFNVRKAEVEYLRPFRLGDRITAWVRVERVGGTSFTLRIELTDAAGTLHNVITLVTVQVDLAEQRAVPIGDAVRAFLHTLMAG